MDFLPCFSAMKKYKNQDYPKLKRECKSKGNLFIDLEFPPDDRSLFYSRGKLADVVWKRPKQICDDPKLFVEGASAGDVTQGRLGNCWFVAASSCLSANKEVWHRVIPDVDEQEWDEKDPDKYQGIFHFRFWRYGEWMDIVIDDMLPTLNNELIFIHSQSKNEFWSALLEKAYAKLFGCYEALDGGELGEALEDFTGGVSEQIDVRGLDLASKPEERADLFERMKKQMDRKSLMAASIPAENSDEMEAATDVGLVKGHAYGITAVKNIHLEGSGLFNFFNREKIPMIRLRNPWGEKEWNGAFSDGSQEWNKISLDDRQKIGLTFEDDGEFWMTMEDFCRYFVRTAICCVVNTSIFAFSKTWHEGLAHGKWVKPERAGGCLNHKATFLKNPQFTFDIDDQEDEPMIQLVQKSSRGSGGSRNMTIGFSVIRVEENRRYRMHDMSQQEMVTSSAFRDSRAIFLRHKFTKGRYAIVACTFDPENEGDFLLRMYTSSANNFKVLRLDKPQNNWWQCCGGNVQLVTRVKVMRAEGLERQDRTGADPYCVISCEGEKVTTKVVDDTTCPEWNSSAIFYRKSALKKPLKIQIWNKNIIKDQYMGKHVFTSTDECRDKISTVGLVQRGRQGDKAANGQLYVQITQTKNVTAV